MKQTRHSNGKKLDEGLDTRRMKMWLVSPISTSSAPPLLPLQMLLLLTPFSTNLRNISLTSYYDNVGDEENIDSTSKPDRRDLQPGRALDIGKPDGNSVAGESFTGLDLSRLASSKVN